MAYFAVSQAVIAIAVGRHFRLSLMTCAGLRNSDGEVSLRVATGSANDPGTQCDMNTGQRPSTGSAVA
jgi:hypothetical protein